MDELSHHIADVKNRPATLIPPLLHFGIGGVPPLLATGPSIGLSEVLTTQLAITQPVATHPAVTQSTIPSLPIPITQIAFSHSPHMAGSSSSPFPHTLALISSFIASSPVPPP